MKKFTYLLAVAAVFTACNSGNNGYTVTGTVEGAADGDTVYLETVEGRQLISPILAAFSAEQTRHPFGFAFPDTTASAKPSQPGKPHPPQFAPGSSSRTCSTLSSTGTASFCAAMLRPMPNIIPSTAITIIEYTITMSSSLYQTGEAHEGYAHQACGDECDREAFEVGSDIRQLHLLADTCEKHDRECKAERAADTVYYGFEEIVRLCDVEDCNAQYSAVRRDQRKINAERFIQRRAYLLYKHFNQLN